MKREELQIGQTVYLAELVLDQEIKERLVVHELEVVLLGKRFYELKNPRRRVRHTWDGNMGTIKLLGTSRREAVLNLERRHDQQMDEWRATMRRREEEALERRKLFTEYYNSDPA